MDQRSCHKCGSSGHLQRNCPFEQQNAQPSVPPRQPSTQQQQSLYSAGINVNKGEPNNVQQQPTAQNMDTTTRN
jgi:hypothetical protein